ncbi:hypothetical protein GGR52DRAFT_586828 [Hypoxylon sp. FL1284]|nr:hypothetical protein GGR52DRAFT_586828 [Hypoxylon sp. FL1284]
MDMLCIILAISSQFALGLAGSTETKASIPSCITASTFNINTQDNVEGDVDFTFGVTPEFDEYTSVCSGKWGGQDDSWHECEEHDGKSVLFKNSYILSDTEGQFDIQYSYPCKREDGIEADDDITVAVATTALIMDFDFRENITSQAKITVPHRIPSRKCTDASEHPVWVVDTFVYQVDTWNSPGGPGIGGVSAFVQYNLLNKANNFSISCRADRSIPGATSTRNNIIDPSQSHACSETDLIPAEDYPRSEFKFDKEMGLLSFLQYWECDDSGDLITYTGSGVETLPAECTTLLRSTCDDDKITIEGEVTNKVIRGPSSR